MRCTYGDTPHPGSGTMVANYTMLHLERKSTNLQVTSWNALDVSPLSSVHESDCKVFFRNINFNSPSPPAVLASTIPLEEYQVMSITQPVSGSNGNTNSSVPTGAIVVVSVCYAGVVPGHSTFFTFLKYELIPCVQRGNGSAPSRVVQKNKKTEGRTPSF